MNGSAELGSHCAVPDGAKSAHPSPAALDEARLETLAAIEARHESGAACAHCGATLLIRWGRTRRGLRRWRCRACGRTFSAATGTLVARIRRLVAFRAVATDMLAIMPRSCRHLAADLGLGRMTVWRWRHRIANAGAVLSPSPMVGATYFLQLRESRKASREWRNHDREPANYPAPDRLRWVDYKNLGLPLPEPMSRFRVTVRLDGSGAGRLDVGAPPFGAARCELAAGRGPASAPRATGRRRSAPGRIDIGRTVPKPTPPPAGSARADAPGVPGDGGVIGSRAAPQEAPTEPLMRFLTPFRGPATRHLPSYLAWFQARIASTQTPQPALWRPRLSA